MNCILKGKEQVKHSKGKGLPQDETAFEKKKCKHMACFRDFKIQVYLGPEEDGTGEVGRGHLMRLLDVMLRN